MTKGERRPGSHLSRIVGLSGITLIVAILVGAMLAVVVLRDREIETWRKQMGSMSLMLSEYTSQTIFSAYLVLDAVTEQVRQAGLTDEARFRAKMSSPEMHALLRGNIHGLSQIDVLTIVAANGDVLNFSRAFPVPPINLADRDYFKAHLENSRLGDFISTAVRNKGNNKWTFYISRRLDDANGHFIGLVLVGLSVDAFTDFYESVAANIGTGTSISLFRTDLTLLARAPRWDDIVGKANTTGATSQAVNAMQAQHKDNEVILASSPRISTGESVLRLAAVRKTTRYPLLVSLIAEEGVVLASWRHAVVMIVGVSAMSIVVLLLGLRTLTRNLARRELAEESLRAGEASLRREQLRLQTILHTASDGIHILDEDGLLIEANPAFLGMLGYSPSAIGSARVADWDVESSWDAIKARNDDLILRRATAVFETRHRRQDGHVLDVEINACGIEIEGKGYLYAASRDISQRKANERELVRAKEAADAANLAKSQFLATMSHEIRTPLNGVLGMAQLLLMPGLAEEDRMTYARTIVNSGQTLLSLLNDILDMSKIEAGRMEFEQLVFDPAQLIREVASLFAEHAHAKGLVLEAAWKGADKALYRSDPVRLRQVLSNLVNNAIKFTPQGSVRIEGLQEISEAGQEFLKFSVFDTGIGIPREKLGLLFKPFSQVDASTTREYGGSGLGLSIVSNLARLMQGEVGVESEVGKGTCAWFRIPATAIREGEEKRIVDRKAPVIVPVDAAASPGAGYVLVVEDNQTNRKVIEAFLKKQGVRFESVENGEEAVKLITSGARPDLVLMDCQMPVMDGFAATATIRRWEQASGRPRLPIAALTAGAFQDDRDRCIAAGMDDFLTKPISLAEFVAVLGKWLVRS